MRPVTKRDALVHTTLRYSVSHMKLKTPCVKSLSTKGSEVRVNMDEPENPAMVNLAHMGSLQGVAIRVVEFSSLQN